MPGKCEIHQVVVMRVGEDDIRNRRGVNTALAQLRQQFPAYAKSTYIDQNRPAFASEHRDRAPAESAMTDSFTGISLYQNVDLIHSCLL